MHKTCVFIVVVVVVVVMHNICVFIVVVRSACLNYRLRARALRMRAFRFHTPYLGSSRHLYSVFAIIVVVVVLALVLVFVLVYVLVLVNPFCIIN